MMARIYFLLGRKKKALQTAIADFTAVAGTPDSTLADVTASHDQTILNANFTDVAGKINAIIAVLEGAGIVVP
jgi:hypothetical protein